jgi:tRNA (guanine-N7-)-methyltransferase
MTGMVRHIGLTSLNLPWPTDWADAFGLAQPLIVEIGYGRGRHLRHLAQKHPEANVIGLEVSNISLVKVERAIQRGEVTNLRAVHTTAETALHHLFEPATLAEVYVNFPDPWFKSDQHHRRLMKRPMLDVIVNRLQAGGKLYLATDIIAYAKMSAVLLADTPGLDNLNATPWLDVEPPGRFVTKYESKARREGRECYYFGYRRNDSPAPVIPVSKELSMPHIVFQTPLTLDEMLAQFEPRQHSNGDIHIKLLHVYRGQNSLLFEVYVKDPTIDQRAGILLIHRPRANEYTLKLGLMGNTRPTEGIHQAVALLGDWLQSLHPDTQIVGDTVRR